jgi:hypothetical protein
MVHCLIAFVVFEWAVLLPFVDTKQADLDTRENFNFELHPSCRFRSLLIIRTLVLVFYVFLLNYPGIYLV